MKIKWFDYLFVLRPTLFFPVWTLSAAGYWAQERFAASHLEPDHWPLPVMYAVALYTLAMGSVFLVNQIMDVESDRLNNKLYLIANGDVTLRHAWIETLLLTVLPFGLAACWRRELAIVMVLSILILGWLYSCPPFSLKNRPISGALTNLCGGYLVFSFGWLIGSPPDRTMFLHATPYALGLLSVYFFTTLPDLQGDKAAKKITVAVKFGHNAVLFAGFITDLAAILMAVYTNDPVILIPTLLSLPFFAKAVITKNMADVLRTNKFSTLFLSLAICIKYYLYLVIITFVFIFSKWYYKKRFSIDYPSFKT